MVQVMIPTLFGTPQIRTFEDVYLLANDLLIEIYEPTSGALHYYPFRALIYAEMTKETSDHTVLELEEQLKMNEKFKIGKGDEHC
jgi:hypothetical protein